MLFLDALAHGALFDAFVHRIKLDDAIDEDAGGYDVVESIIPGSTICSTCATTDLRGGGHDRVEVPRGLPVDQVALGVGLPGVDDRQVGVQAAFHHIEPAIEFLLRLALGDLGAGAGGGEEGRDAGAARADAFGQRALRVELDLQVAGQVLAWRRWRSRRRRS